MSFYIQISDEEMSEEIVYGSEDYDAALADGSLTDETLVWAEHLDGWTPWGEIKDSEYITSGGASGGGGEGVLTSFFYEGNDDELPAEDAVGLVEAGTIQADTLIYSTDEAFPFEGWTAWSECSYLFGVGEAPTGVTTFFYEGNDDELAAEEAAGLAEAGTIEDDTLIYSTDAAFPFEGWTTWADCSYLFGVGEAPAGAGGGAGGALCTSLYYEGCDDEIPFADVAALEEAGEIHGETLIYSDQEAFPFEGWTEWADCKEYFGEGGGEAGGCTTLSYTNDGETTDDATAEDLPGLVAAGTITDDTNVYSTDDGFTFEGWTEYRDCKHLFVGADAEEGEAPEPEISEQEAGEVDETEKAEQAMKDTLGADQAAAAAKKEEEAAAAAAAAAAKEEEEKAAKKAAMDAKRQELEEVKAKAKAEKEAKAKAEAEAKAADEAARDAAGLGPVPTEISDADLEALEGADFELYFKMDKAKWGTLPPFRKPMVKKAAMQRWVEAQEAENSRRAAAWQKTKDDKAKALKTSADKRLAIGQFIAEKGYEALLMGSQKVLAETALYHGPINESTGMGWNNRYCMVWPKVRVPNIPPGDKFMFFYKQKGASKPDRVAYLQPGKFTCKKTKQGKYSALRFEAPLVMKGKKFGKELKFMLGCEDQKQRDAWVEAFTNTDIHEDEAHDLLHGAAKDAVSHYDFEVTHKKKTATLTVTKETLKIFQKGKLMETYAIKSLKSWSVGTERIVFKLTDGGEVEIRAPNVPSSRSLSHIRCREDIMCPIPRFVGQVKAVTTEQCLLYWRATTDTKEGQGIKDALVNQAKQMIQEKKDAKAAEKAKQEAEEEAARLKAEEEAEEALRWLTHEELRTGNYERYIAAGSRQGDVDEKNKETLMTDAEFEKVFGMTKDAFQKLPAFKKPMLKKKHGLGPFQFNE